MTATELAAIIDHTCLAPDATAGAVERVCAEAVRYGFHSVCVAPSRVAAAARMLAGERVRVCTVAGFPLGNSTPRVKLAEATAALELGADEVDMVMQIGALKDGDDVIVRDEIVRVAEAVHAVHGALLKVILETALLCDDEVERACRIACAAGADFVKTSTGFGPGGATVETVRLMRRVVGERAGVKAAGGIRDYATAAAMVAAGATRLGASSSVAIVASAPDEHAS
jgi:deoxyribose-phosphate aldolase